MLSFNQNYDIKTTKDNILLTELAQTRSVQLPPIETFERGRKAIHTATILYFGLENVYVLCVLG